MADAEAASVFPGEFKKLIDEKGYLPEQVFYLLWKKMPNGTDMHKRAKHLEMI